jgi:colanic acid/amylovoran biosynthesis glycosyltransferase
MINYPLAIFAPHIGAQSETFIRRHMEDLLPGRTAVVATTSRPPYGGEWSVDCPNLVLDQVEPARLRWRLFKACALRLGFPSRDHVTNIVKRFLEDCQVKVVVGEYLDLSLPWFRLCREMGIKFFGHAHGYDVSERLREAKWRDEYLQYNSADGVITMSQVSRERLLSLGLDASKVHVIPYGVDVAAEPIVRDTGHIVRCIAVGRMVAKKAPILTLDAFRRASEVCPELRLDYVGTGELLPAVQHFVRAFNLGEKVILHRGQSNEVVRKLLKAAEIFVQHSMTDTESGDEEGCPVAILEAMSHSLPVVSTSHAGIPEAVLNGITGYLVDEGNSVAMAERIVALVQNPVLRRQMGISGWERAKEHFSWEEEKMRLVNLLDLQR